ncbi:MAG: 3-oxoacyl-ACP reductase FabG [Gammaproteobacteria bacterium]
MDKSTPWVLVTGGTRGIGKGIVQVLAASGYRALFTYRSSSQEAELIEADAASKGQLARGYRCDGADPDSVQALVERLVAEHGAPAALVNNAGITADTLLVNMPLASWDAVIDANLKSVYLFSKAILPSMMEAREGVILNMSSITAIKGNVGQTNYGATKAGMIGMSRSLALEVGRFNIRVNCLLPGLVDTEMIAAIPDKERAQIRKSIPLKRLCGVDELGRVVRFLISEDASYLTGQTISLDGGLTA